ncbi:uncharacterized protein P174DRAFT_367639, partial [Aspergillus novofumigatus IBT 16806]
AQEVVATPTGMTSAPMILPFQALYDRAPGPNESDITITTQEFRAFVQTIFWDPLSSGWPIPFQQRQPVS